MVATATILTFYRTTFLSGFDLTLGDYGDTRFNLAVLEHAYRFATGQDSWRAFNFFYPVPVALGYSDALFLLAVPYVVARFVGLSAFNALQATLIAATSIAFFATLFFLRGLLRLGWLPALTGAAVFAGSSMLYQTLLGGHTQMMSSAWVPCFASLALMYVDRAGRPSLARLMCGAGGAILLIALLYTSYNTGWFVGFQALVVAGLAAGMAVWNLGAKTALGHGRAWLARNRRHAAFVIAAFTVASVPFLMTYLPVLKQAGRRRPYRDVFENLPRPLDLIHPAGNWLWDSDLLAGWWPELARRGGELGKGMPWVLLLLFFSTLTVLALRFARGTSDPADASERRQARVAVVLGGSVLICWALVLRLGAISPWLLVYGLVPGAIGIRTAFRINLVLMFSVVTVTAIGVHLAWRAAPRRASTRRVLLIRGGLVAVCAVLLVEEVNNWSRGTDQLSERRHFGPVYAMSAPPAWCRTFALIPGTTGWSGSGWAQQLDAVSLAHVRNIPTVNGYSGMSPYNWNLEDPSGPRYPAALVSWVSRHDLAPGLCGVDLAGGRWAALAADELVQSTPAAPNPDIAIDFRRGGNSASFCGGGWSAPEPAGTWTDGARAEINLHGALTPGARTLLEIEGRPFLVRGRHPTLRVDVLLDGETLARWTFDSEQNDPVRRAWLPAAVTKSTPGPVIELKIDSPASPKSLGVSNDVRNLGLFVTRLTLRPAPVDGRPSTAP